MTRSAALAALAAALFASAAQAQFANRSLGVSLGYTRLNTDQPFDWAVPLTLESSLYIENGFDLTGRFLVSVVTERVSQKQIVAIAPSLGVRYLFSEESLRPYAGVEMAYLYVFRADGGQSSFLGIGPNAGVDYFVGDTVSLGARGFFNLYVMLNVPPMNAFGAQLVAATYF